MNENKILNKVRALLGMEVKLEQMKLTDGVSVLEADAFEAGNEVFIVTEDEQKIPLPVGEYELEDMRILVVLEEGMIADIREAAEPEVEVEVEEPEAEAPVMEEEMAAEVSSPKKTIESIIKETFFSKMEELQAENESLKAELAKLSAQPTVEAKEEEAPVELSCARIDRIILDVPGDADLVKFFCFSSCHLRGGLLVSSNGSRYKLRPSSGRNRTGLPSASVRPFNVSPNRNSLTCCVDLPLKSGQFAQFLSCSSFSERVSMKANVNVSILSLSIKIPLLCMS
jgi:hypothetical protein